MHVRIELTISTSSKETNKLYFKKLLANKEAIENLFGGNLIWEELPDNKMSRVKIEEPELNLFNDADWDDMNIFFMSNLPKFEKAFQPFIKKLKV